MHCLDIIKQNQYLSHLPEESLRFLTDKGRITPVKKGGFIFEKDLPSNDLIFVCSGYFRIYANQKDEQRELARLEPGDITGVLPYSRMTHARGYCQALEDSEVLLLDKKHFPQMITERHDLTEALVHLMSSRIREFTTSSMQNEKLMSLGKLSAGLAHELNNPAAAMVRSSAALSAHLKLIPDNFKDVLNMKVGPEDVEKVSELIFDILGRAQTTIPLMERTRREDELTDLLDAFAFEGALETAEELVDFGITPADVQRLHSITGDKAFAPTLKWIVNNLTTERSVKEINASALRIAELIGSIKEYSHMDTNKDRQDVDVNHGLRSTLKMLEHKARANKVTILEELDEENPMVNGFPGELNQVWTNFIDNALDAMETTGGALTVKTERCEHAIDVTIADTGVGIPPDVKNKIFDPFFTTKAIGKGTGLGLDIANKIILPHKARVEIESEPGNTRFTLSFPIATQ
jgi:signal transduction histidine kinase